MYDRFEEMPTLPFARLDDEAATIDESTTTRRARMLPRALDTDGDTTESLTTTLPVAAADAYRLMCDVDALPSWMSVVRSARILDRTADGRATRAAFLARLEGASIGYTLHYRYWDDRRMVAWTTTPGSTTVVAGRARFDALGARACLMYYELSLTLPALPRWRDPAYNGHPLSAVIADFREHVDRHR